MNLLRKNDLFLCQVTLVCQVLVIEHGDKMVTMLAITGMANFSFSQFENVLKITLRVQYHLCCLLILAKLNITKTHRKHTQCHRKALTLI